MKATLNAPHGIIYSFKIIGIGGGNFHLRGPLCVIFTILVSFSPDNALFASKAKINVLGKNFERSGLKGASGVRKNFKKR